MIKTLSSSYTPHHIDLICHQNGLVKVIEDKRFVSLESNTITCPEAMMIHKINTLSAGTAVMSAHQLDSSTFLTFIWVNLL
jgi:hypothetical protein